MTKNLHKLDNQLLEQILNWDLKEITNFVIIENPDIPSEQIIQATKEYKYFVYLKIITGQNLIIPTKLVDFIWHAHILHTKEYFQFCETIAGYYIHHTPELYNENKYQNAVKNISNLSKQIFGNIVFDFSKQSHTPKVYFTSY